MEWLQVWGWGQYSTGAVQGLGAVQAIRHIPPGTIHHSCFLRAVLITSDNRGEERRRGEEKKGGEEEMKRGGEE